MKKRMIPATRPVYDTTRFQTQRQRNVRLRKKLRRGGYSSIKIQHGKVVSKIDSDGKLILSGEIGKVA